MNRERELLQRALADLAHIQSIAHKGMREKLISDIITELEKPGPVECGWVAIVNGVLTNCWNNPELSEGTHKLLAVRIDDEQKI